MTARPTEGGGHGQGVGAATRRGSVVGSLPSLAPGAPRFRSLVALGLLGACAGAGPWAEEPSPQSPAPQEAVSYSLGYQLGDDLATLERLGTPPDLKAVLRGISDALAGTVPSVGVAEMGRTLDELRQKGADRAGEAKGQSYEDRVTAARPGRLVRFN